ncbi:MAG TPA: GspH/FimT family pseudopilin [Xanthomonadaceae bacterium]|nr:GspH/FimT family pseudopilin [Xanthomonadaceae bacterium]
MNGNAQRLRRGSPRAFAGARHVRGFTLLEIMMVIVLIAAITGLTVGLLGVGRSGSQLRSAAHTVAAELRYTRARALTTGVSQVFDMDLDKRSWTAAGAHHGTLPSSLRVNFVAVRLEQTSARNAAIRFFPDGSSTGGRVSLRTQGSGWRVDVRWLTGEVTQSRLTDADR